MSTEQTTTLDSLFAAAKGRSGILSQISDWLKLLALLVLVAEVLVIAAMKMTPDGHPMHGWYPALMLLFLAIIVVGVLIDRYGERRSQSELTLALGDREIRVDTSRSLIPQARSQLVQMSGMYSDSQKGFMLPQPKSKGWLEAQHLDVGAAIVKSGLIPDIDKWNQIKATAEVMPLGKMIVEGHLVRFEHGGAVDLEVTHETSTSIVENAVKKIVELAGKEGKQPSPDEIAELRQTLLLQNFPSKLKFWNAFNVNILEKSLAAESPLPPTLANVFLAIIRFDNTNIERLVANEDSIMWGSQDTVKNIVVNGAKRDITIYRVNRLVENERRVFALQATFSPQTDASIYVWDELQAIFNSFRIISQPTLAA